MELKASQVLSNAAIQAKEAEEYNSSREPGFRMSKAGIPVLFCFLEDFTIPKLIEKKLTFVDRSTLPSQSAVEKTINVSIGYLFEQIVGLTLKEEYPSYELHHDVELEYKGILGHSDWLLTSEESIILVECKAITCYEASSARETKLQVDNYGYRTQMALYLSALRQRFPDKAIKAEWRVWSKPLSRYFRIEPYMSEYTVNQLAEQAVAKKHIYELAKELCVKGEFNTAASILLNATVDIPLKEKTRTYWKGTCSFHFTEYSKLILDYQGRLKRGASEWIVKFLKAGFGDEQAVDEIQTAVLN